MTAGATLAGWLVLASLGVVPAESPVTLELEAASVAGEAAPRIGDRVDLVVHVTAPLGATLSAPRPVEQGEAYAFLAPGPASGSADPEGGVRREIPLTVVPLQVGEVALPGVEVDWSLPDGRQGTSRSDGLTLSVRPTVEGADAEPADIRGPAEMPVPASRLWLLAGVGALAAALLGAWLWRRRRRPAPAALAPAPPPDPFDGLSPADWALRELQRLVDGDLLGREGSLAYHVRLAEILRWFLQGEHGLDALERTSTEILAAAEESLRPLPATRARLRQILSACDLVKFARHRPPDGEALPLAAACRRFVEETRVPSRTGAGAA